MSSVLESTVETASSEDFVVFTSRWRHFAVLITVPIPARRTWLELPEIDRFEPSFVLGTVALAIFAAAFVWSVSGIVKPKPAVTVRRDGLVDHSWPNGVGFMSWDEIGDIREFRRLGMRYLGIVPRDRSDFFARVPVWKRLIMGLYRLFRLPPVIVPESTVTTSLADLLREIEKRRVRRAA
jgi:hypothetical protein